MIVVLHNIRSMHNVGSIFRTADAVGVEKVYLCGITPAPIDRFGRPNEKIAKVSLGAEKTMPYEQCRLTSRCIDRLAREGYRIIAVEQHRNSIPYTKAGKRKKTALILGDEVRGLPESVLSRVDAIVEIPMRGAKESLNVAVAFGIVAYALRSST